jgi:hypothetical protein
MSSTKQPEHLCWVCNKPVELETAKTDDRGRVVHEECYAAVYAFNEGTKSDVIFDSLRNRGVDR